MSSTQITFAAVAAVLLFWMVGAYNRLMAQRNTLLRRFGRFDEQFGLRHALLMQHLDGVQATLGQRPAEAAIAPDEGARHALPVARDVGPVGPSNESAASGPPGVPEALRALRAACVQARHACDAARHRPSSAESIRSLRLAEQILQGAVERVRTTPDLSADRSDLFNQLAVCETGLQFARQQFNDAAREHNDAMRQFPTCLLAGPFGFHAAGQL